MLMVVERNDTVCWMQPNAEISQEEANLGISSSRCVAGFPMHGGPIPLVPAVITTTISSHHTGGANFGLRDGGVTFISETLAADVFAELICGTTKERP